MIKAYGYLRVSGTGQVDGDGFDRLAREYVMQEQLLVYLAAKGITLWNASTGENVTEAVKADPMKKAVIHIQGVFAELEKSLLVNRLAKARERKRAENGKCEGAKGWEEVEPERKEEILKIIKKMRRKPRNQGKPSTYQAIADCLNAEGMRPLRGGEWSAQLVRSFHSRAACSSGAGFKVI